VLQTPDGQRLAKAEAVLLERIGLKEASRPLHVRVFGPLAIHRKGEAAPRWPRRKALTLLGLLTLHPGGLSSDHLSRQLFAEEDPLDPQDLLHTVAYALRKVLKSVDADDLLASGGGMYRLNWQRIAFCDLHEFDGFFAKAQAMEAQGLAHVAADFYEVALTLKGDGALFENLPEAFEAKRAAYAAKQQHARRFLKQFPERLT
jgi:two-component SAPR family response regulator